MTKIVPLLYLQIGPSTLYFKGAKQPASNYGLSP